MFNLFAKDKDAVTVDVVKKAIDDKEAVTIIDVRMPDEYWQGHIAGSRLLPLSELTANFTKLLDKSKKIYVYCRSGARSARAVSFLKQMGYQDVHDVTGGLIAWADKGYPLVK